MKPGILKSKSTEDCHYQVMDEKLKPFQALLKEANGSEEILSLLNSKIMTIFLAEFEEKFSLILQVKAQQFMETLCFRVTRILEDMYKIQISNYEEIKGLISKTSEIVKKEKFLPNYKNLASNLAYYESKLFPTKKSVTKTIEIIPFMKSFRRHCKDSKEAIHTCGDKLIEIYDEHDVSQSPNATHLMCVRCKASYLPECVQMRCDACNVDFFSCLKKEDGNYEPATWKKYHCGAIINDKMRCIKCKEIFYLNCETGLLECLQCNLKIPPMNIQWTCMICKGDFSCEAKIYSSLEFRYIKTAIKEAIIKKESSRPVGLPCCKEIDLGTTDFFHKKECTGTLYSGDLDGKKIVVCSLCKTMNFYEKFIWTCPFCEKRFRVKEEESKQKNTSFETTPKIEKDLYLQESGQKEKKRSRGLIEGSPSRNKSNSISRNESLENSNNISSKILEDDKLEKIQSGLKVRPFIPRDNRASPILQRLSSSQVDVNFPKVKKCLMSSFNNLSLDMSGDESSLKENIILQLNPSKNSKSSSTSSNNNKKEPEKINLTKPQENEITSIVENFHFNIDEYEIIKCIGEGSYGKIYKVENKKTKKPFALKKIIAHTEKEVEEFQREYEIMNWVTIDKHCEENILNILGVAVKVLDLTTTAVYVLMELADSDWEKEINSRARARSYYTEQELLDIISLIIKTLAKMQKENISHRDIKPQNILIFNEKKSKDNKNKYKLADFGEAKELQPRDGESNTLRGTELYMSPLLFSSLRFQAEPESKIKHDPFKSDVFSLGLCTLLAGSLTFKSLYEIRELYDMRKISVIVNKYLNPRYSKKLINLVLLMLRIEENKRPDFLELSSLLD
jgi:hypothetical protein